MALSSTFLIAASVLAVTPGPGIMYVVARTVSGGKRAGLASCVGTAMGGLVHVLAAALGISMIVAESALAFAAVKYIGAAYLLYLGITLLASRAKSPKAMRSVEVVGAKGALRDGIVVEALNVKTALFFLAFIPQFVDPARSVFLQFVLLGTFCVALNTLADVVAVVLSDRFVQAGPVRTARERVLSRISGSTMVALGIYLAIARRQTA